MTNYDGVHFSPNHETELPKNDFPLLGFLFDKAQKAKTLLMLVGRESVGGTTFPEGYEIPMGYSSPESFIEGVQAELKRLGFFSKVRKFPPEQAGEVTEFQILYSKNSGLLDSHIEAYAQGDDAVGRSFGFPETAVAAFSDDSLRSESLPDEIKTNGLNDYLPFFLSRDHSREEWQWFIGQLKQAQVQYPSLVQEFGLSALVKAAQNLKSE
jgi:hypothetical protein